MYDAQQAASRGKMKSTIKTIAGVAAVIFFILAGNLEAQTNLITITATLELQGSISNNGVKTILAGPERFSLATKQLLALMAVDENAAGNYGSTNFPTGAKLVEIDSPTNADYQVLDKNNNFLADVTNVLSLGHSTNEIYIGRVDDATRLNSPTLTYKYEIRYTYDDSAIGGGAGMLFYFYGLATKTITDTTPKNEIFTETKLSKASSAQGDGNYQGTPFVMTGSIVQSRKDTFILN